MHNLSKKDEIYLKFHYRPLTWNLLIIEPSMDYEHYLFKLNHIRLKTLEQLNYLELLSCNFEREPLLRLALQQRSGDCQQVLYIQWNQVRAAGLSILNVPSSCYI